MCQGPTFWVTALIVLIMTRKERMALGLIQGSCIENWRFVGEEVAMFLILFPSLEIRVITILTIIE